MHHAKLLFLALALFMFVAAPGCGEDPAPKSPGPKQAKGDKEGKGKDGKKKEEPAEKGDGKQVADKAADEAKDDAPAKDEKDGEGKAATDEPAKGTAEKAVEAAAIRAKERLGRTLKKVTAYGVTGPIDKTRDALIELMPETIRPMLTLAFVQGLNELGAEGNLTNMDWLDLTRGVGFGFEGKDKPLLAIPIKSVEAFEAALPEGMKPDGDHGYAINDSYLLPYTKHLLVSDSYRTIELIEGDLKLELTRLTTDKLFHMILSGESLKTLMGSALDEVERTMGENMPMQQEQKEFITKFFNFVKELLGEIDQMNVTLELDRSNLKLRYEVTAVDGTKLAQTCAALEPGHFQAATYLPSKSYFVAGQHTPHETMLPWLARYVDMVATAWKLKDEEKVQFAKKYTEMVMLFGPDSAFSLYSDSSFPLSISSVSQTRGGMAVRDTLYDFYGIIIDKVLAELPPDQRQMFADRSLKDIVDSFAPVLVNLGVSMKMDTEKYQGGMVDYLLFTFDWDKLNLPLDAAWVREVIKSRIGGALGFSKDYVVMTFGPNPIVRAKEILDRSPGLKLAELAGPDIANNKYIGFANLSFNKLVSGLLEIGVVAQFLETQDWVPKLKDVDDLVVLSGAQEGGVWAEMNLGIGSAIQAFNEPLVEAFGLGAGATGSMPPAGN